MFLSGIGTMAKRVYTKAANMHKDCKHCTEVATEFLSLKGLPIMGECEFAEHRFLLREATDCKNFKMA